MVSEEQNNDMELASEIVPVPQIQPEIQAPEVDGNNGQTNNGPRGKPRHRKKMLYAAILKQMEFYFGDSNLTKDRFLGDLVKKDPYVDIDIFLRFNKIRNLTTDRNKIVKAIRDSKMLKISEDGNKVYRTTPIVEKKDIDECTVYIQRLPADADHEWLINLFSEYGPVAYVSIPKFKNHKIKGFAFIEFETQEGAEKCLKAFRKKGFELPSQTSPTEVLSITTFADEEKDENELADISDDKNMQTEAVVDVEKSKNKKRKRKINTDGSETDQSDVSKPKKKKHAESKDENKDTSAATCETEADVSKPKKKKHAESKDENKDVSVASSDTEADVSKPKKKKHAESKDENKDASVASSDTEADVSKPKKKKHAESKDENKDVSVASSDTEADVSKPKKKKHAESKDENKDVSVASSDTEADVSKPKKKKHVESKDENKDVSVASSDMEADVSKPKKKKHAESKDENKDVNVAASDTEVDEKRAKKRKNKVSLEEVVTDNDSQKNMKESNKKKKKEILPESCDKKEIEDKEEEDEESIECTNEEETSEKKKKRKRKRKHNSNEISGPLDKGLQVMGKKEWKKLRNKYLDLQRSRMKQLKQHMRKARWNQWGDRNKMEYEQEEVATEKKENTSSGLEFTPGVIVKVKLNEACVDPRGFKTELKNSCNNIKYIDVKEGLNEAFIRCDSSETALTLCQRKDEDKNFEVLEGEDEKCYWDKIIKDREEKLAGKVHVKQRGRNKLLKKAEKVLGIHIKFEEV